MSSYLPTETILLCVLFNAGEPKEFTLQFRAAENFPLDVYFLLDVTVSFSQRFRDTVPSLAADLCRLNVCVLSFQWRCNILFVLCRCTYVYGSDFYVVKPLIWTSMGQK